MSADTRKRGLGRGLDALFRDVRAEEESFAPRTKGAENAAGAKSAEAASGIKGAETAPQVKRADEIVAAAEQLKKQSAAPAEYKSQEPGRNDPVRIVRIEKLTPGTFQPRRLFDEQGIDELADSIAIYGVLQPLFVRPHPNGGDRYEIIGGERRWRAAQKAQLHEVPVIVRALDDKQAMEIGLIENLQRADLTPMEEAEGYQRLMDEFSHTQETLAAQLGKSRSHIANLLRLLKLPESVRRMVQQGTLSAGHARALVGAPNAAEIAGHIVAKGLSVRQAEQLAKGEGAAAKAVAKKPATHVKKDVDVLALERRTSELLGLNVTIEGEGAAGKLVIEYKTLEQLDDLLMKLSAPPKG